MSDDDRKQHEQNKLDLPVFYKNLAELHQGFDDKLRELNRLINEQAITEKERQERTSELNNLRKDITLQEEIIKNLEDLIEKHESQRYQDSISALEQAHEQQRLQDAEARREKIRLALNITSETIDRRGHDI